MTQEEFDQLDYDNLQLPPLPQRPSRRNSTADNNNDTTSDPSNNNRTRNTHTTVDPSSSSSAINNPTDITDRNMDTTTSTPTTPTNTTTTTMATSENNNAYDNMIANMNSYKDNLIHQLLGTQGRAATSIVNNTTALGQLDPPGPVSPVSRLNDKLKSLLTSLNQPLEQLLNLTVTIKDIGSVITQGNIPTGCIPTCRLGIPNPPAEMKETWDKCLYKCGKQITAILLAQRHRRKGPSGAVLPGRRGGGPPPPATGGDKLVICQHAGLTPYHLIFQRSKLYIFTVETIIFSNLIYIIMYIYIYIYIYIQLYRVVCYHLFMRINIIMFLLFSLLLHWYDGIKRQGNLIITHFANRYIYSIGHSKLHNQVHINTLHT